MPVSTGSGASYVGEMKTNPQREYCRFCYRMALVLYMRASLSVKQMQKMYGST